MIRCWTSLSIAGGCGGVGAFVKGLGIGAAGAGVAGTAIGAGGTGFAARARSTRLRCSWGRKCQIAAINCSNKKTTSIPIATLNVVPELGLGIGGFASGWGIE